MVIARLPVLLLFVGSGLAALVYELVWFQMLQLVVGSSSVSMGVLLGTFMGGMCAGSLLLPRLVSARRHPLRVYAALEAAIGGCGLLLLAVIPLIGRLYTSTADTDTAGAITASFILRGLAAAICLLPPTLAMGATLPAIARWVEGTPQGMSWLGRFYAGNTIGAVLGSLLAGFYLLRVFDVTITTAVAAAVNLVVALVAWMLAQRDTGDASRQTNESRTASQSGADVAATVVPGRAGPLGPSGALAPDALKLETMTTAHRGVLLVTTLSGFTALSAEVVWTRYLSLLFGATVYTFSIILAVFLTGLGLGSGLGAWLAARMKRPAVALAVAQFATLLALIYSGVMLAEVLPFQPGTASLTTDIWKTFTIDTRRAFLAILPGPIGWGASFPLALAVLSGTNRDTGRLVGGVYAANTLGAIAGALLSSLVLVSAVGTQHTQQLMLVVAALSSALALWIPASSAASLPASPSPSFPRSTEPSPLGLSVPMRAAGVCVVAASCVLAVIRVPAVPAMLVAYGRNAAAWVGHAGDIFFVGEGLQASVAVSRLADGSLNYHNAGKIQASSMPQDMRLQRMLGHLTTLVPKEAKSVLVIGCGAGVTAGAVSVSPKVEKVTIAEIEPLVPAVVSKHFAAVNHAVISNPKVHVHIDDARHFLSTTGEQFDAITSDPLDPWVKGAAALYTKEFFELAKSRLKPGGVVTLFVQLYESSPEAVKSEIATFFEVFPHGLIFGNTWDGHAEDTVLVGMVDPPYIDVDAMETGYQQPEYLPVRQSLGEIGIYSIVDLLGRYAGRAEDLQPWLSDAAINRDRDLRLQYLAGLGLNEHLGRDIYQDLLQYRKFPDDVFIATDPNLGWLRAAIEQPPE